MSEQATIVLVHGFWGGAAHWSKVITELTRRGHSKLRAVELSLTSLADDARRTQQMVAQQSGPVLLVGHSYGGAVITEAGDLPKVFGLVYMAERMKPRKILTLAASHASLASRPAEVAALIDEAAIAVRG